MMSALALPSRFIACRSTLLSSLEHLQDKEQRSNKKTRDSSAGVTVSKRVHVLCNAEKGNKENLTASQRRMTVTGVRAS